MPRFVETQDVRGMKKRASFLRDVSDRFVMFAGCQEEQTAADAYINGSYNGAFTYFWIDAFEPGMTYAEWIYMTQREMVGVYEQTPLLIGNEQIINSRVLI